MKKLGVMLIVFALIFSGVVLERVVKAQSYVESFDITRIELSDLLANPKRIEPSCDSGWQYSVTGWEQSNLND